QELSAKKTVEIERHLESCDKCTKTLESWRAIHSGFQNMEEAPAASPFLKQKIMAMAEEELDKPPSLAARFMTILRPVIVFPVALLIILALFTNTNKQREAPSAVEHKMAKEAEAPARPDLQRQAAPAPAISNSTVVSKEKAA